MEPKEMEKLAYKNLETQLNIQSKLLSIDQRVEWKIEAAIKEVFDIVQANRKADADMVTITLSGESWKKLYDNLYAIKGNSCLDNCNELITEREQLKDILKMLVS